MDADKRTGAILARQSALIERAMAALGPGPSGGTSEGARDAMTDKAFALLDRTMGELEEARSEIARLSAGGAPDGAALDLLSRTMKVAEQRDRDAARFEELLARALDGIARLEAEIDARDQELQKRETALSDLLALSERSLSAAEKRDAMARSGFFARLFGGRPTKDEPS
ncbi:MAG: hypothetical protein AAF615_05860 [Pseudomonadota bacterium]